jgi:lipopolysaccharide/colanic/teichoic acid biosynthesis glycosyltransferase
MPWFKPRFTPRDDNRRYDLASRAFDVVLSAMALVMFLPLIILTAAIIWLQDGGPIFFLQPRVGLGGKIFDCLKFRSMAVDADRQLERLLSSDPVACDEWARDQKLRDDPRVTPFGAFLRRSSIDELPQLLNVLAGDMSLVGPRPIVESEIPRYGRHIEVYCSIRPGITGLWQVSGRNDLHYRRRVAMDVLYARRRSLRLDTWLIIATVQAVLSQRGSY